MLCHIILWRLFTRLIWFTLFMTCSVTYACHRIHQFPIWNKGKDLCGSHKTVLKQILFFCRSTPAIPRDLDSRTSITIGEKTFSIEADDLESICVLGRGAYGVVEKVKHKQTGTVLAVKVHHDIRNTGQMCSWPQYQTSLINNYVIMDHSLIVGCRGVLAYNKGICLLSKS